MKVNGSMTLEEGKVLNDILMVTRTMALSKMEKLMEKVSTLGVTEKFMMENGIKA